MTRTSGYDIVGDIHGQADALQALLAKLGYRERGCVWKYPGGERRAIFVGDYIDRNPHARHVLDIMKRMTEEGEALAVMGNHEFNAVAYYTEDPEHPGEYLRPHSDKNREQHSVFLEEMGENEATHDEAITWFRTLPMWLDLGALRVVHASWVDRYRAVVEREADPDAHLSDALLVKASRRSSEEFDAIECLLKGLEVHMPEGVGYRDSYGTWRMKARLCWWLAEAPKLLRDAILGSPAMVEQIGDAPWSGEWPDNAGYPADAPPVFIGHYWLDGEPEPQAENVVCVDYSAAKRDKKLVAYRWDGEQQLTKEHFVSVPT
ncbi:MAG: metallophosphoesterase [Gammaproteobacteria bacterium]